MTVVYHIETPRLRLRQWRDDDYAAFARMNADAEVMRYFPALLERKQSDALTAKFAKRILDKGWGFWATERKSDDAFIGLVGLNQTEDLPFPSCVEVGWRLDRPFWGSGYATEAASASLYFAFSVLGEERIAAFTATANFRSRSVMERLGMKNSDRNFLHPKVDEHSGLKEHVFYEVESDRFLREFEDGSVIITEH